MKQKQLSPVASAAVIGSLVLALGGAVWWKTLPNAAAQRYSDTISKLESSPEFERRMKEREERKKTDPSARHDPGLPADQRYQPEFDGN